MTATGSALTRLSKQSCAGERSNFPSRPQIWSRPSRTQMGGKGLAISYAIHASVTPQTSKPAIGKGDFA